MYELKSYTVSYNVCQEKLKGHMRSQSLGAEGVVPGQVCGDLAAHALAQIAEACAGPHVRLHQHRPQRRHVTPARLTPGPGLILHQAHLHQVQFCRDRKIKVSLLFVI